MIQEAPVEGLITVLGFGSGFRVYSGVERQVAMVRCAGPVYMDAGFGVHSAIYPHED